MAFPQTPTPRRQANKDFQNKHSAKTHIRLSIRTPLFALLIVFVAVASLTTMHSSSAASANKLPRASAPLRPSSVVLNDVARRVGPDIPNPGGLVEWQSPRLASLSSVLGAPAVLFFQQPPLATYDGSDCTTSKTSFNLGDKICVKVSGAPTSSYPLRRLVLINPGNATVGSLDVTSSTQTFSFTLPSLPSNGDVDNRGTWVVGLVDTADATLRRAVPIQVHDPNQVVADVTISKTSLDTQQITAGNNMTYRVYVTNQGPDEATNVRFTDDTLPNTTFVSFLQDGDATFTCTRPAVGTAGSTVCTKPTMTVGQTASFTALYKVNTAVGDGADLTDTVSVASDTFDSHPASNDSTVATTVSNPTPPSCTLTCPNNITQDSDPNQPGAVVNYNGPSASSGCSTISCDHPSGSLFPIGSTTVTCSDPTEQFHCNFVVTINGSVAVTVNGNDPMTVECHTSFTDPGATATDSQGNSVPVTSSGTVDPNTPGTYTITYTATSGNASGTDTRTVNVVDSTPPTITLNGPEDATNTATVECHTSYTVPTATASDSCDSQAISVTTSGSVDTNTPGDYVITYSASDASGNPASRTLTVHVVDTTAPSIVAPGTITLNTGPGATSCGVTVSNLDATLGTATASDSCSSNVTVTRSGVPAGSVFTGTTTITYTATDSSGNHSSASQTVIVQDDTPPTITAPAAVTVNTDAGSCSATGVALGTPTTGDNCSVASVTNNAPATFPLGATTVTWTVRDASGNTATATQAVTVEDHTPPVITLIGANPITVTLGSAFSDPGATATDNCSASLPVTPTGTVNTGAVGTYTITYTATDPSNNTRTATRTVNVIYNFTGFLSPVSNLPTLNSVTAGRAVPVKFSLSGNRGLSIFAAGSPASQPINCATDAAVTDLQGTTTAGSSSLSYDATTDQYSYVWKTDSSWAGQCRQLVVTLNDGSTHTALFKFK